MDLILDQLSTEVRSAMRATLENFAVNTDNDSNEIARYFMRRLKSRCGQWTRIPDRAVDPE
jgi:hypothetical protein